MIKLPERFMTEEREDMLKDLFLLDPQVVFLNHGSFGACPQSVFEEYQSWQRRLERQPVQFLGEELDYHLRKSREILAEFLHTSADNLVYIPNATHGVNIIARSLNLQVGDEILSTDQEYGACSFAWDFIGRKTGVVCKRQPIELPVNKSSEIYDQLWQGVTAKTKFIFISHITSPTSLTLPVQKICQRAREAGIITIIDGAHAPGQLSLDIASLQADFYIGNCHKWMLSPKGAGFLFASPEVQPLVEPLIVSWGYQSRLNKPKESTFIDFLQWTGTKDPSAALSVPAAIAFMDEYHWDEVRLQCHTLLKSALTRISDLTRLAQLYPSDSDLYHQMATIPIPKMKDLNELKGRLLSDYKIEIPTIDWNDRHYLRISVQGYNSPGDIDTLVEALTQLLPQLKV